MSEAAWSKYGYLQLLSVSIDQILWNNLLLHLVPYEDMKTCFHERNCGSFWYFCSHCRFQTEPKSLRNFGEELQIPLYVEVIENEDIDEYLPCVPNEGMSRTRRWAIIPKRLVTNIRTFPIELPNGKSIRVARIGEYLFSQLFCSSRFVWLIICFI